MYNKHARYGFDLLKYLLAGPTKFSGGTFQFCLCIFVVILSSLSEPLIHHDVSRVLAPSSLADVADSHFIC